MGGTATGLSQIAGLLGITVLNVHNINHDPYIGDAEPWPGYKPRAPEWMIRRSEEHTSELQSLMRISYAVFCLKKKKPKLKKQKLTKNQKQKINNKTITQRHTKRLQKSTESKITTQ